MDDIALAMIAGAQALEACEDPQKVYDFRGCEITAREAAIKLREQAVERIVRQDHTRAFQKVNKK